MMRKFSFVELDPKFVRRLRKAVANTEKHINPLMVAYEALGSASEVLYQAGLMKNWHNGATGDLRREGLPLDASTEDVLEFIDAIVKKGENINLTDNMGCGLLHYYADNPEIIKKVVELGGDINISRFSRDENTEDTPLYYFAMTLAECDNAADYDKFCDTLKLYLDLGADPNQARLIPTLARYTYIEDDDDKGFQNATKILDIALSYGADINQTDSNEKSAMTYANNLKMVRYLLEHKADPSKVDYTSRLGTQTMRSHLWDAISSRNFDKAKILLESGADPNTCYINVYGSNMGPALFALLYYGHNSDYAEREKAFIRLIVQYGADLNMTDGDGESLLTHRNNVSLPIRTLIELGADVNYVSPKTGNTYLHNMTQFPFFQRKLRLDNITALLEAGADINAQNHGGKTPFQLACIYYCSNFRKQLFSKETYISLLKTLVENGADINIPSFEKLPKTLQKELIKSIELAKYRDTVQAVDDADVEMYER